MSGTTTSWFPLRTSSVAKRKRGGALHGLLRQMPRAGLGENDLERHSSLLEGDQPLVPQVPRSGEIRQVLGDRARLGALRSRRSQDAIGGLLQFGIGGHVGRAGLAPAS